jgi:hypothetical protein
VAPAPGREPADDDRRERQDSQRRQRDDAKREPAFSAHQRRRAGRKVGSACAGL